MDDLLGSVESSHQTPEYLLLGDRVGPAAADLALESLVLTLEELDGIDEALLLGARPAGLLVVLSCSGAGCLGLFVGGFELGLVLGGHILDFKHFLLEKETNLLVLFLDSVMLALHRGQLLFDGNDLFLLLIDLIQLALQIVELGHHL